VEQPAGAVSTSALVYSCGPGQPDASIVELPTGVGGASALVYSSGPGQPDASIVELPTGVGGASALVYSSGPGQPDASIDELPTGVGGASALVYSSGPGQPDAFSVEQPAGLGLNLGVRVLERAGAARRFQRGAARRVGGTSVLVYSSGPGQPDASSVEQPTGDLRHLGARVLERYGAARRHQRGLTRHGDRHLGARVIKRAGAARRLCHGAARRGGFEPWCSCA
jgi:hypothetical protein